MHLKGADDEIEERKQTRQTDAYKFIHICGNACIKWDAKKSAAHLGTECIGSKQQRHIAGAFQTSKKYFKNIFIVCASSPKKQKKNHKHVMNICFIYARKKSTLMMIHARTVHFINTRCALNWEPRLFFIIFLTYQNISQVGTCSIHPVQQTK